MPQKQQSPERLGHQSDQLFRAFCLLAERAGFVAFSRHAQRKLNKINNLRMFCPSHCETLRTTCRTTEMGLRVESTRSIGLVKRHFYPSLRGASGDEIGWVLCLVLPSPSLGKQSTAAVGVTAETCFSSASDAVKSPANQSQRDRNHSIIRGRRNLSSLLPSIPRPLVLTPSLTWVRFIEHWWQQQRQAHICCQWQPINWLRAQLFKLP